MNEEEYAFVCQLLKKRSGLALTRDKMYLLEGRLLPLARSGGHADVSRLLRVLRQSLDETIITEVVDAMTTNESKFFRDHKPFEQLIQVILPHVMQGMNSRKLRIWSAGCAGGQEAYSIAMCLAEQAKSLQEAGVEIVATDISQRMVDKAQGGVYSQFEVQRGLPVELLMKYFTQTPDADKWKVKDALKSNIAFSCHNLLEENAKLGRFDVIFCRNVLFYFDEATKRIVLDHISRRLAPKGILILGSSETTQGVSDKFRAIEKENALFELQ